MVTIKMTDIYDTPIINKIRAERPELLSKIYGCWLDAHRPCSFEEYVERLISSF